MTFILNGGGSSLATISTQDGDTLIDGGYRFFATGEASSGGEALPDVDPGGLCLNQGTSDGNIITLKSDDVAHGMTSLAETDTFCEMVKESATEGGLSVAAYSEGSAALVLSGAMTNGVTGDLGRSATEIEGAKKSGTSLTVIGASENCVGFLNNGTVKVIVKGNGDIVSQGGVRLSGGTDLLDTYDEGTWTPVLTGTTTPGSHTYATQSGNYTRVGNIVHLFGNINISSKDGTISGGIRIGGLPYIASADPFDATAAASFSLFGNLEFSDFLSGYVIQGGTEIRLRKNATGTANTFSDMTQADLGSNPRIIFKVSYRV